MSSVPEHMASAAVIVVKSLTAVRAMDGRDRDSRVMVACRAVVLGDKVDLVPMIVINVASRVIAGRSVLFLPSKDHLYHPGALIARAGLHHSESIEIDPVPQVRFHHPSLDPTAVPAPVSPSSV